MVNSTSLIPIVQKQYRILAFPPLQVIAAKNVCGSSKVTNDIIDDNVNGDDGSFGHSITLYPAVRAALLPGPGVGAMIRTMAKKVTASIDRLQYKKEAQLFAAIRHEITLMTTDSVYGQQNPFRDPEIEQSFWYASAC